MRTFLYLILIAGFSSASLAQDARISGHVFEIIAGERLPIPFARMILKGHGANAVPNVPDIEGAFSFSSVKPGVYVLIVSAIGFRTLEEPLTVRSDDDIELRIRLSPGSVGEMVVMRSYRNGEVGSAGADVEASTTSDLPPHIGASAPTQNVAQAGSAPQQASDASSDSIRSTLRLATWNIRWFPRGCPDWEACPELQTDLELLAGSMADLNLDLIALQEILADDGAKEAMSSLIRLLDHHTGGNWMVDLQECGPPESQHVGFLWNSDRVELSGFRDIEELNGDHEKGGGACAENLRPGRYAYVRSLHGGADFHAVTVHFDSGTRDKDFQNRRDASRAIPALLDQLTQGDNDFIVFGDLNTMGQREPKPIAVEAEFAMLDSEISPYFRRLPMQPSCTEYYKGSGGALDHFLVSTSMGEAALVASVGGYCAEHKCSDLNEDDMPAAYNRLSDHCPVILEVADEDLD